MTRYFLQRVFSALGSLALLGVVGCAEMSEGSLADDPPLTTRSDALATPWRTVQGGFLGLPSTAFGLPVHPGGGAFIKLLAPTAVALLGNDLLIVDSGTGRTYRYDMAFNALTPIAGAPAAPGTQVALGGDLSAWVLDTHARQVLRFARDGRLMQTFRDPSAAPAPVAFALLDNGLSLMLAEATLAQLVEIRAAGTFAIAHIPTTAADRRIASVSGVATAGDGVYVLDRSAGAVHQVLRDGSIVASFGQGQLKLPTALAADPHGRVFVVDPPDRAIKVFEPGEPMQTLSATALGVQQIGGLAIDGRFLAVTDRLTGQVVILMLRPGGHR